MTNVARNITINYEANTIEVSKTFYKKASQFGTPEYKALRVAKLENKDFSVEIRTVEKKTYRELTLVKMEEYIRIQDNSEQMLVKVEAVKRVAKAKGSLYPLTKKWFLKTFEDYAKAEVENEISEKLLSDVEKELAEIENAEETSSDNSVITPIEMKRVVNQ